MIKTKKQNIEFIQENPNISIYDRFYPQPASHFIPEWYKSMDSYLNKEKKLLPNGSAPSTIKRCMPVFDAITMGYVIPTHVDISITNEYQNIKDENTGEEKETLLKVYNTVTDNPISFHNPEQAKTYPNIIDAAIPKFENPWIIKTPPGYSTLFVNPIHQDLPFKIFEGVVDTDVYNSAVNFPFVLKDQNFEGIIPAGTPFAQIIIFKREDWLMRVGDQQDLIKIKKSGSPVLKVFFDAYKTYIRKPKSYK